MLPLPLPPPPPQFKGISCWVPKLGGPSSPWASLKGLVTGKSDAPQAKEDMRQVLFSVSGSCEPGEVLALMGPSGGGKVGGGWVGGGCVERADGRAGLHRQLRQAAGLDCTLAAGSGSHCPLTHLLCSTPLRQTTLLSILGGRTPKQTVPEGRVLFNGTRISKRVKRQIGFVLQVGGRLWAAVGGVLAGGAAARPRRACCCRLQGVQAVPPADPPFCLGLATIAPPLPSHSAG